MSFRGGLLRGRMALSPSPHCDGSSRAGCDLEPSDVDQQQFGKRVPAGWATKARVSNLTAVQGKSGTVLIGSFIVQRQARPDTDPVDEAVFLIAERNVKGAYEASYSRFRVLMTVAAGGRHGSCWSSLVVTGPRRLVLGCRLEPALWIFPERRFAATGVAFDHR